MIKSFSGHVVFCFALRRAISAYVGENRLSQYSGPGGADVYNNKTNSDQHPNSTFTGIKKK